LILFSRRRPVVRPTLVGTIANTFFTSAALSGVSTITAFGSNPGALRMHVYAPPRLRAGRPLVVVLHGCRQDAASFAADAGWIAIAQQFRLALLLPEQTFENNKGRCFNWFRPDDVRRGSGEIMSIRQMIRHAITRFGSDPKQIFVAGFSAGGGMAAALLAAYPAVFAAGGIVAGMPAGCAKSQMGAMLHMRQANLFRTRMALANDVRKVTRSNSRKAWPRLSIWQGERDGTVDPSNAEAIAAQWSELHGYGPLPTSDNFTPGVRRRIWSRPNRAPSVELWTLKHQGHGFPVDPHTPAGGRVGAWLADAGLSAAQLIIAFWGLDRPRA
jgi:poly(hydroxyalkanoate) depolymerase family esterase